MSSTMICKIGTAQGAVAHSLAHRDTEAAAWPLPLLLRVDDRTSALLNQIRPMRLLVRHAIVITLTEELDLVYRNIHVFHLRLQPSVELPTLLFILRDDEARRILLFCAMRTIDRNFHDHILVRPGLLIAAADDVYTTVHGGFLATLIPDARIETA